MAETVTPTDEALLDEVQRAAFDYFRQTVNPANGLVADTSRENSPVSIAVVGFALSSYPVAVERGPPHHGRLLAAAQRTGLAAAGRFCGWHGRVGSTVAIGRCAFVVAARHESKGMCRDRPTLSRPLSQPYLFSRA
jgi:hypothetical protein